MSIWDDAEENSGLENNVDNGQEIEEAAEVEESEESVDDSDESVEDPEEEVEDSEELVEDSHGFATCDDSVASETPIVPSVAVLRPSRNKKPPTWHENYDMTFAGVALGAMDNVNNLPDTIAELKTRADWLKLAV